MPFNQRRQVNGEQLSFFHHDAPVDDGEFHVLRLAEDGGSQRIMNRAARVAQRVQSQADEVGGHAGGQRADVVTAQHLRAAARRQPQRLFGGEARRIAPHPLEQ